MREINVREIENVVKQLCIDANYYISDDIKDALNKFKEEEPFMIAEDVLDKILLNADIAANENVPICQDTGMACIFIEVGQDVHFVGGLLEDVIYYNLVKGDKVKITLAPKGFGSENMSKIAMLKPADGLEGVKKFILDTVKQAGPNPCPPMVIGVGIGGTFDKAAYLAKKALIRPINERNKNEFYKDLEIELLEKVNKLGIGPQGFGGRTTAIGLNIETYPTHIAGLPVAVNINCHATRHKEIIL